MRKAPAIVVALVLTAAAGALVYDTLSTPKASAPTPAPAATPKTEAAAAKPAARPAVKPEAQPKLPAVAAPTDAVTAMRKKIEAYGKAATHSAAIEAELVQALKHADQDVRGHSAWALGRMAPKSAGAVPALVGALGDAVWSVQHNASWALVRFPIEQTRAPLTTALNGRHLGASVYAARALLKLDPASASATEQIIVKRFAATRGTDRVAALKALAELRDPQPTTVALVHKELVRPGSTYTGDAVTTLSRWGSRAAVAVPDVIALLSHKNKTMRIIAASALAGIGVAKPEVVSALVKSLSDPKEKAGIAAADALSSLEQLDALETATKSESTNIRRTAMTAVLGVPKPSERRMQIALAMAKDPAWEVRIQLAASLGHPGVPRTPATTKVLNLLAKDKNTAVSDQAKAVLKGRSGPVVMGDVATGQAAAIEVPKAGAKAGAKAVAPPAAQPAARPAAQPAGTP